MTAISCAGEHSGLKSISRQSHGPRVAGSRLSAPWPWRLSPCGRGWRQMMSSRLVSGFSQVVLKSQMHFCFKVSCLDLNQDSSNVTPNTKHWFTTSFLWRKMPENGARSVLWHLSFDTTRASAGVSRDAQVASFLPPEWCLNSVIPLPFFSVGDKLSFCIVLVHIHNWGRKSMKNQNEIRVKMETERSLSQSWQAVKKENKNSCMRSQPESWLKYVQNLSSGLS